MERFSKKKKKKKKKKKEGEINLVYKEASSFCCVVIKSEEREARVAHPDKAILSRNSSFKILKIFLGKNQKYIIK